MLLFQRPFWLHDGSSTVPSLQPNSVQIQVPFMLLTLVSNKYLFFFSFIIVVVVIIFIFWKLLCCSFCFQLFSGLFQETQRYDAGRCHLIFVLLVFLVCMFCVWCNAAKGFQVKGMENILSSYAAWAMKLAWFFYPWILPIRIGSYFILACSWGNWNFHHGAMIPMAIDLCWNFLIDSWMIGHSSILQNLHASSHSLQRPKQVRVSFTSIITLVW